MSTDRPYHHGDLHQAVLAAAVDAITESGPTGVKLRDLARRAGVSHAAPAYHFGDKAGLLTALAAEGYTLLADALDDAQRRTGSFQEAGVAYVRFAVRHRAHFAVMFQPDLYNADDPAVRTAQARANQALTSGVDSVLESGRDLRPEPEPQVARLAAWSLVHGFATLWLNGSLSDSTSDGGSADGPKADSADGPEAAARAVVEVLFRS